MSTYTVRQVDTDGTVLRTLVNTNVLSIERVLNGVGQAVFTFPKIDPPSAIGQAADVKMLFPEIQILRDGAPWWWGVPLIARAASNKGDVQVTCSDLGWYLTKRALDKTPTNLISNPDFEAGLTSWSTHGAASAAAETDRVRLGTTAARLTNSAAGDDGYIAFNLAGLGAGPVIGRGLALVGWFFLESFTASALGKRGLYIEGRVGGVYQVSTQVDIDSSTVTGEWQRFRTTIVIPTSQSWDIEVRLYSPQGSIVWDAVELMDMESVGGFNLDLATLAQDIVIFIQAATSDKDNLNIATAGAATGIVIPSKFWQIADHVMADRALDEFVQRTNGIDWSIETTATTRTFTTWHPKGTDRTGSITLSLGSNVAHYDYAEDGTQVETDVTILGDSTGEADRELGHARDTSHFGGRVLQGIYPCTPGATINELTPQAQDKLARSKRMVRLPQPVTVQKAGDLVGTLAVGDKVSCSITDGWVQVTTPFRVVGIRHVPKNETLTLTLNEV
jgi:hypothetical protein